MNTTEFDRIKARLKFMDNQRITAGSSDEAGGAKRPTLKRKTTGPSDSGEASPKRRRPTLKREEYPDGQSNLIR